MTETIPEMCERFPEYAAEVAMWHDRFMENVGGVINGTVEILDQLRGSVRLFALSNWPAETAADLKDTYRFFDWFDGIVISGEERVAKPDPEVFLRLCDRYALSPHTSLFVDDAETNTTAAEDLGFRSVLFSSPDQLCRELRPCVSSPRRRNRQNVLRRPPTPATQASRGAASSPGAFGRASYRSDQDRKG